MSYLQYFGFFPFVILMDYFVNMSLHGRTEEIPLQVTFE